MSVGEGAPFRQYLIQTTNLRVIDDNQASRNFYAQRGIHRAQHQAPRNELSLFETIG